MKRRLATQSGSVHVYAEKGVSSGDSFRIDLDSSEYERRLCNLALFPGTLDNDCVACEIINIVRDCLCSLDTFALLSLL